MGKKPTIDYIPESLRETPVYKTASELIDLALSNEAFIPIRQEIDPNIRALLEDYDSEEAVQAYNNVFVQPFIGTKSAILYVLNLLNIDAELVEWFRATDITLPPYKFILDFDSYPEGIDLDKLIDLILAVRNERASLAVIRQPDEFGDLFVTSRSLLSGPDLLGDVSGFNYRGVNIHLVQKYKKYIDVSEHTSSSGMQTSLYTRYHKTFIADWPLGDLILGSTQHYEAISYARSGVSERYIVIPDTTARTNYYYIWLHQFILGDDDLSDGMGPIRIDRDTEDGSIAIIGDNLELGNVVWLDKIVPYLFGSYKEYADGTIIARVVNEAYSSVWSKYVPIGLTYDTVLGSFLIGNNSDAIYAESMRETQFSQELDPTWDAPTLLPRHLGSNDFLLWGNRHLEALSLWGGYIGALQKWGDAEVDVNATIILGYKKTLATSGPARHFEIGIHDLVLGESELSEEFLLTKSITDYYENLWRGSNYTQVNGFLGDDLELGEMRFLSVTKTVYIEDYKQEIDQALIPSLDQIYTGINVRYGLAPEATADTFRETTASQTVKLERYGVDIGVGFIDTYKVNVDSVHFSIVEFKLWGDGVGDLALWGDYANNSLELGTKN
jgi:hypothetical protein